MRGACVSVVVKALLVGRSRDRFPVVSLDFSVIYFLPAVPWPWGRLNPQWKWVPGTFLGVKAAGAWGWQPHHLHVPNVMKSGSLNLLETLGPHRACYVTPLPLPLPYINVNLLTRYIQWIKMHGETVKYLDCTLKWKYVSGSGVTRKNS
jgi:hypothetical protein